MTISKIHSFPPVPRPAPDSPPEASGAADSDTIGSEDAGSADAGSAGSGGTAGEVSAVTPTSSATPICSEAGLSGSDPVAGELGELAFVDPAGLIVGVNIRSEVNLDAGFVASLAAQGVREPIPVRRRGDGALVVRRGQRRVLGAVRAGLSRVRVYIEPGLPDGDVGDPAPAQVSRIVEQMEENLHRAALAPADEVSGHQLLLGLGLSARQIAMRTHQPRKRSKTTTTIAASEVAAAALARYELTLDQAAAVAEFDQDHDAVTLLTAAARQDPARFPHVLQRLRDEAADRDALAARRAELEATGVAVLDDPETETPNARLLTVLRASAAAPDGAVLTEADHAGCPGHAAHLEGLGWTPGQRGVRTRWMCTDPREHGHVPRWNPSCSSGQLPGTTPGPMSDQQKAERRTVIANNRAWDSATVVRHRWLKTFLGRRSAPGDAGAYVLASLAGGGHALRRAMESGHRTACELLGLDAPAGPYSGVPNPITIAGQSATGPRVGVLSLAVVLGAAEEATDRITWRAPSGAARAYFTALSGWGYPLSEVEQLVTATSPDPEPDPEPNTEVGGARDSDASGATSETTGDGAASQDAQPREAPEPGEDPVTEEPAGSAPR